MNNIMQIIEVKGIKCYAYHGCMDEEAKIGTEYLTDVAVLCDFSKAARLDDLSETVDYVTISRIVKKEMEIRSKLIETVLQRIINSVKQILPKDSKLNVTVIKRNPPIGIDVPSVSVTYKEF
jgi:dihydroneopterin aldolase